MNWLFCRLYTKTPDWNWSASYKCWTDATPYSAHTETTGVANAGFAKATGNKKVNAKTTRNTKAACPAKTTMGVDKTKIYLHAETTGVAKAGFAKATGNRKVNAKTWRNTKATGNAKTTISLQAKTNAKRRGIEKTTTRS